MATSTATQDQDRLTSLLNAIGFSSLDQLDDFVFLHGAATVVPTSTLPNHDALLLDTQLQQSLGSFTTAGVYHDQQRQPPLLPPPPPPVASTSTLPTPTVSTKTTTLTEKQLQSHRDRKLALHSATQKITQLELDLSFLRSQLSSALSSAQEKSHTLDAVLGDNETLRERCQELEGQVERLEERVRLGDGEIERLDEVVRGYEGVVDGLEGELEEFSQAQVQGRAQSQDQGRVWERDVESSDPEEDDQQGDVTVTAIAVEELGEQQVFSASSPRKLNDASLSATAPASSAIHGALTKGSSSRRADEENDRAEVSSSTRPPSTAASLPPPTLPPPTLPLQHHPLLPIQAPHLTSTFSNLRSSISSSPNNPNFPNPAPPPSTLSPSLTPVQIHATTRLRLTNYPYLLANTLNLRKSLIKNLEYYRKAKRWIEVQRRFGGGGGEGEEGGGTQFGSLREVDEDAMGEALLMGWEEGEGEEGAFNFPTTEQVSTFSEDVEKVGRCYTRLKEVHSVLSEKVAEARAWKEGFGKEVEDRLGGGKVGTGVEGGKGEVVMGLRKVEGKLKGSVRKTRKIVKKQEGKSTSTLSSLRLEMVGGETKSQSPRRKRSLPSSPRKRSSSSPRKGLSSPTKSRKSPRGSSTIEVGGERADDPFLVAPTSSSSSVSTKPLLHLPPPSPSRKLQLASSDFTSAAVHAPLFLSKPHVPTSVTTVTPVAPPDVAFLSNQELPQAPRPPHSSTSSSTEIPNTPKKPNRKKRISDILSVPPMISSSPFTTSKAIRSPSVSKTQRRDLSAMPPSSPPPPHKLADRPPTPAAMGDDEVFDDVATVFTESDPPASSNHTTGGFSSPRRPEQPVSSLPSQPNRSSQVNPPTVFSSSLLPRHSPTRQRSASVVSSAPSSPRKPSAQHAAESQNPLDVLGMPPSAQVGSRVLPQKRRQPLVDSPRRKNRSEESPAPPSLRAASQRSSSPSLDLPSSPTPKKPVRVLRSHRAGTDRLSDDDQDVNLSQEPGASSPAPVLNAAEQEKEEEDIKPKRSISAGVGASRSLIHLLNQGVSTPLPAAQWEKIKELEDEYERNRSGKAAKESAPRRRVDEIEVLEKLQIGGGTSSTRKRKKGKGKGKQIEQDDEDEEAEREERKRASKKRKWEEVPQVTEEELLRGPGEDDENGEKWLGMLKKKRHLEAEEIRAARGSAKKASGSSFVARDADGKARQVEINPERNGGVDFEYRQTVREKEARKRMYAQTCDDCANWYERTGNHVACKHTGSTDNADFLEIRKRELDRQNQVRLQQQSRHRQMQRPEPTPPDYWQMGFPPTALVANINARAALNREETRAYKEQEAAREGGFYRFKKV